MSNYATKLSSLAEKKQKLLDEENKLIEKRKAEIGAFAEKFNLLTASDALMAGLFSDAQAALKDQPEKIKTWEHHGAQLLKPKSTSNKKNTNEGKKDDRNDTSTSHDKNSKTNKTDKTDKHTKAA